MADYTYAGIRAGLVANLAPLGIQSKGFALGSVMAPAIECFPGEVDYDQAFRRGHDDLAWTVRITVAVTMSEAAQQQLDGYLAPSGDTSVKTLIESDSTLGGAVDDLHVETATGYQIVQTREGGQALSCDWTVRMLA